MVLTMTSWLSSGRPRQFIEMCENGRCSILFHVDVPGGKWQTVMSRPVSSARWASSAIAAALDDEVGPSPRRGPAQRVATRQAQLAIARAAKPGAAGLLPGAL